ncbi:TlpA disulfide reductase family protein [Gaetbulibacter sp. M235]|uniref:TlpA disulfide reductase family protein n=1 Tax=Gaetbulibacter sp. M235 TaxID=3126510 RepID=UPI00374F65D8
MKSYLALLLVTCLMVSCKPKETDKNATIETLEQFSDLQTIIDSEADGVLVLNFWSIHCPPCIKELPHFNTLETEYQNKHVRVLLINLDFIKKLDPRLYPFVKKQGIKQEIMILKDQNYTKWTEHVDPDWYGALPATLIIKGDKRHFRFGSYEQYADLKKDLDALISQ